MMCIPGTDIPKNFSSRVLLQRPETGEKREVLIYMNNPLRYAGETYYQSSFDPDDHGTILQVVHNPSWLTPYFSCVLVGVGLGRPVRHPPARLHLQTEDRMSSSLTQHERATHPHHASRFTFHPHPCRQHEVPLKLIPWFFVALFGAEIVAVMLPKKDGEYHVREFGRLPVLLNGRIQPFDSVARNSLLQIRSTGDVPLEEVPSWQFWHHPKKLKSTEWLLEVMTRPEIADTRPIFLIHHAELLGELKLQDKGVEKSGLRYYTFNELKPLVPKSTSRPARPARSRPRTRPPSRSKSPSWPTPSRSTSGSRSPSSPKARTTSRRNSPTSRRTSAPPRRPRRPARAASPSTRKPSSGLPGRCRSSS